MTSKAEESHLGDFVLCRGVHVEKKVAVVSPRTFGEVAHRVVDVLLDGDIETSEGCTAAVVGGEFRDEPDATRRIRSDGQRIESGRALHLPPNWWLTLSLLPLISRTRSSGAMDESLAYLTCGGDEVR